MAARRSETATALAEAELGIEAGPTGSPQGLEQTVIRVRPMGTTTACHGRCRWSEGAPRRRLSFPGSKRTLSPRKAICSPARPATRFRRGGLLIRSQTSPPEPGCWSATTSHRRSQNDSGTSKMRRLEGPLRDIRTIGSTRDRISSQLPSLA